MSGVINEKEHYIYKEWTAHQFPEVVYQYVILAEETEVDQEERGQPDTQDDGTNLKRLTTWSRGRPFV